MQHFKIKAISQFFLQLTTVIDALCKHDIRVASHGNVMKDPDLNKICGLFVVNLILIVKSLHFFKLVFMI
jgi:hypothetical protein